MGALRGGCREWSLVSGVHFAYELLGHKLARICDSLERAFFSNGLLQDENIDHAGKLKSPSSSPHPSQQDILYQNMIRKWTDAHKERQIFEDRHTEDAVGSNV